MPKSCCSGRWACSTGRLDSNAVPYQRGILRRSTAWSGRNSCAWSIATHATCTICHKKRRLSLKLNLLSIPDGFYVQSLSEKDADLVNEEWPNHHVGSLYFVQRQIRLCVNVGLYATDTRELVAWCIRLQGGFLGALQVRSTHKRRGFGSLVAKEMARHIAVMGQDVMALVNPGNQASNGMFDKLGFKVIDQCVWLRTEPVAGEFT
ncbi:uncharacterized protein LOC135434022 isoform X2 [Drosophila montana]|uniref:uncharacterized protein LOC135434022 isoform X2 n=1 Tax=Drosophila montana TaxID=40370 RepID=UPI00313EFF9F